MKLNGNYIIRKIAGETVILSAKNDDFNGVMLVNEIGARILELLQSGIDTEHALVESLLMEYNAPAEMLRKDVRLFLEDLKNNGILCWQ